MPKYSLHEFQEKNLHITVNTGSMSAGACCKRIHQGISTRLENVKGIYSEKYCPIYISANKRIYPSNNKWGMISQTTVTFAAEE